MSEQQGVAQHTLVAERMVVGGHRLGKPKGQVFPVEPPEELEEELEEELVGLQLTLQQADEHWLGQVSVIPVTH